MVSKGVAALLSVAVIIAASVGVWYVFFNEEDEKPGDAPPDPTLTQAQCANRNGGIIGNNCYVPSTAPASFASAERECELVAGTLAAVTSADVSRFFTEFDYPDGTTRVWLGLNDRDAEGFYVWTLGVPFNASLARWAAGEPSALRAPQEDCVAMSVELDETRGQWYDELCNATYNYLCEFELATAPFVPRNVRAEGQRQAVTVQWDAPASDGGDTIRNYTVTSEPAGLFVVVDGDTRSHTFTGLTPYTRYNFTVRAANAVGFSAWSDKSTEISVRPGLPTAIRDYSAAAGDASVFLAWRAPASTGGVELQSYSLVVLAGATTVRTIEVAPETTNTFVYSLTNDVTYSFQLHAVNIEGQGPTAVVVSTPSSSVPQAPTNVVAQVAGSHTRTLNVTFTVPGGAAPTGYIVTAFPVQDVGREHTVVDTNTETAQPIQVPGLRGDTQYTVRVVARGPGGLSAPSNASDPVTPTPDVPVAVQDISVAARPAGVSVAFDLIGEDGDGGSPVTSYTVRVQGDASKSAVGTTSPIEVYEIEPGTPVNMEVIANNAAGAGPAAVSESVTPLVSPPFAPTGVSATAAPQSAQVSFTAGYDGGSAVTQFTVVAYPSQVTATGASSPITVTNLQPGTPYHFRVFATNTHGAGAMSAQSNQIVPTLSVPSQPGTPTVTGGPRSVIVSATAPTDTGGGRILDYTIKVYNSSDVLIATGIVLAHSNDALVDGVVRGLPRGTGVYVRVTARNAEFFSADSAQSSTVTTTAGPPDAPTQVTADSGRTSAKLQWMEPANDGGSAITHYRVYGEPGEIDVATSGASTSFVVPSLSPAADYVFQVAAVNAFGEGPRSAPTQNVRPAEPSPQSEEVGPGEAAFAGVVISFVVFGALITAWAWKKKRCCFHDEFLGSGESDEETASAPSSKLHTAATASSSTPNLMEQPNMSMANLNPAKSSSVEKLDSVSESESDKASAAGDDDQV